MSESKKTNAWLTSSDITIHTAPPEAYAAFFRIYLDWMFIEDADKSLVLMDDDWTPDNLLDRQMDLIKKNVHVAKKEHQKFSKSDELPKNGPFGKPGSTFYGAEFDEYVNEVWASFLEKFSDPDKFAAFLQKDFERRVFERFCKENDVNFAKIESDIMNMSEEDAIKYINNLEKTLIAKYHKWKVSVNINYAPTLEQLLRRPAKNMMSRLQKDRKRIVAGTVSPDTKDENDDNIIIEIEDKAADGYVIEDEIIVYDIIERANIALTDRQKAILSGRLSGKTSAEIAIELSISEATVSRGLKEIRTKLREPLGISLDDEHSKKRKQDKKQSEENEQ